ncbi:hypothetical protein GCM10010232_70460 [Streptomyces amakusaensis]|uniref:Uncharacterized protein n=1 Tax=Streptomyces amakusaensis TaxID=67271 RepID=A0ABW0ATI3_9ACTN
MDLADLDTDPASAVLAHAVRQAVKAALPDYRASALGRLSRTGEADAEARRAYKAEQGRRWYQHNPNGTDVVTAAAKAPPTPPGPALRSTCSPRAWSSCASRPPPGPSRWPCRGRSGCPSSPRAR